jgi:hypothetical protein
MDGVRKPEETLRAAISFRARNAPKRQLALAQHVDSMLAEVQPVALPAVLSSQALTAQHTALHRSAQYQCGAHDHKNKDGGHILQPHDAA